MPESVRFELVALAQFARTETADPTYRSVPDDEAGEVPIAFVVAGDPAPSEDDIKAFMKETLASYKQVQKVEFVSEIPKSASGKILRRVLREQVSAAS